MSDSFLDHLPSNERRKLRQMMSPEAYEKLREKVKGPEDLEKEMKRAEQLAEAHFELQNSPKKHEQLRQRVEKDIGEQGMEGVLDIGDASADALKKIEQGKMTLTISSNPSTHEDQLMVIPEGHVQEKIPVKIGFSEGYVGQLLGQGNS